MGRVLKILALLRILRLGRFVRYLHQWEDHLNMSYGFAENLMKSVTWTFILIMVGHWNACVLYLIPSVRVSATKCGQKCQFNPCEDTLSAFADSHFLSLSANLLSRSSHQIIASILARVKLAIFEFCGYPTFSAYRCYRPEVNRGLRARWNSRAIMDLSIWPWSAQWRESLLQVKDFNFMVFANSLFSFFTIQTKGTFQVNVTYAFNWLWMLHADHYWRHVGNSGRSVHRLLYFCAFLVSNDCSDRSNQHEWEDFQATFTRGMIFQIKVSNKNRYK